MIKYRPEIDGLRAVAVVPVILFHAGFGLFSGGYVGVDVFFVISGYLIAALILGELEAGTFSLATFYERRARRILPALFVVTICCIPFAWMWMLPFEFKNFSQSAMAVAVFASNMHFWREANYFNHRSDELPLLHTWSLSVEEQFYIVFPLLLLIVWRFCRNRVFVILAILTIVSFALSEYASRLYPTGNFYFLPTRAWELGVGVLCAFYHRGQLRDGRGGLAFLGLAMIVSSVFLFDRDTPFPSRYALLPVVGTALILLFANAGTAAARMLSLRGAVSVGLVSYSAYLWHQPVFAFARIRLAGDPHFAVMAGLIIAVFGLAYLSWRFVERPFRDRASPMLARRSTLFGVSAAALASLFFVGLAGHIGNGFPQYSRGNVIDPTALESRFFSNHGLDRSCDGLSSFTDKCETNSSPEILLWGDSFAMHLAQALTADGETSIRQRTMIACSPVLGLAHVRRSAATNWPRQCIDFNNEVLASLQDDASTPIVVISSIFGVLIQDAVDQQGDTIPRDQKTESVKRALLDLVAKIRETGRVVVLISRTPSKETDTGRCIIRTIMRGAAEDACNFNISDLNEATRITQAFTNEIAKHIPVIKLEDFICGDETCDVIRDGVAIYRDKGHLSMEGSRYLGEKYGLAEMVRHVAQ